MEGKEELLKLANKQLDQAANLLKAAGEELLAEEADALAVKVSLAEAAFTLSCPDSKIEPWLAGARAR